MIKLSLISLSILLMSCGNSTSQSPESMTIPFLQSSIEFASQESAQSLLGTSDEYTASQSAFDNMAKTQDVANKNEADYLSFAAKQAQSWTDQEITDTKKVISEAEAMIKKLDLKIPLPELVKLVKSTCAEEGNAAGYTRQDYIVVSKTPDVHLFLHELFHVISRHDPDLRDKLYATIQFNKIPKLEYPTNLLDRKITNPDAPFFNHAISLHIDDEPKEVVILTIANGPYESGIFFKYLQVKLLELEGEGSGKPKIVLGEPILHDFSSSDLIRYIGDNTGYNIHPEEVLAEHFTMLITEKEVPRQDLINDMKTILQN